MDFLAITVQEVVQFVDIIGLLISWYLFSEYSVVISHLTSG